MTQYPLIPAEVLRAFQAQVPPMNCPYLAIRYDYVRKTWTMQRCETMRVCERYFEGFDTPPAYAMIVKLPEYPQ